MEIYNINYFLRKFEAIPESEIGYDQRSGCAYGQCQSHYGNFDGSATKEGKALTEILKFLPNLKKSRKAKYDPYNGIAARINNGDVQQYQQNSPKERILAALRDAKALETLEEMPEKEEVLSTIRYVLIEEKIKSELIKSPCLN